jgi:hypothetical protein
VESQGATLEVLGVGTTGYAKDILKDVLNADVALVETVAHTESALKFYDDPACHRRRWRAGHQADRPQGRPRQGLQAQHAVLGRQRIFSAIDRRRLRHESGEYAELAFSAKSMPVFGYGCAVFMQSDIVNFQRQGWQRKEILAGLAAVLPKNISLCRQHSQPRRAGHAIRSAGRHAEQSGRGQSRSRFHPLQLPRHGQGAGDHRARALRRIRRHRRGRGGDAPVEQRPAHHLHRPGRGAHIRYRTTRNEDTRCYFCKNNCLRTFIDVQTGQPGAGAAGRCRIPSSRKAPSPVFQVQTKVPLQAGEQR